MVMPLCHAALPRCLWTETLQTVSQNRAFLLVLGARYCVLAARKVKIAGVHPSDRVVPSIYLRPGVHHRQYGGASTPSNKIQLAVREILSGLTTKKLQVIK